MKEKIELQIVDVLNEMTQKDREHMDQRQVLTNQYNLLQQALALCIDVPPDVQTILDNAAK